MGEARFRPSFLVSRDPADAVTERESKHTIEMNDQGLFGPHTGMRNTGGGHI